MTPRRIGLLGALLLGAAASAQDSGQPQPVGKTPAQQEYDALIQGHSQAQSAYYEKYRAPVDKAKAAGEKVPPFEMRALAGDWTPKFQAAAAKYRGTPDAMPFLMWLAGNAGQAQQLAAIDTMLADHVTSPDFVNATELIGSMGDELGAAKVRKMIDQTLSGLVAKAEARK
jgi:hypothetical protein